MGNSCGGPSENVMGGVENSKGVNLRGFKLEALQLLIDQGIKAVFTKYAAPGVDVDALLAVLADKATEYDPNWSTEDVCQNLVIPLSVDNRDTFHEFFLKTNALSPKKFKGVFVSQARACKFSELVSTLSEYYSKDSYVWMDLFAVGQHKWNELPAEERAEWLGTGLHECIGKFDEMCMWFDRWDEPKPLTRGWCMWELLGATKKQGKFRILINNAERKRLIKGLTETAPEQYVTGNQLVLGSFTKLEGRNSQCWNDDDRRMIHEAIEKSVGFDQMNYMVLEQVRKWVIDSTETELDLLKQEGRGNGLEESTILEELGNLVMKWGMFSKAAELHKRDRNLIETHMEPDKPGYRTGVALDNLCLLSRKEGKISLAKESVERSLELKIANLGEDSVSVAIGRHNRSRILHILGDYEEALNQITLSLEHKTKKYGQVDPRVGLGTIRKAMILVDTSDLKQAKIELEKAKKIFTQALGESHHEVAQVTQAMSLLQYYAGNYDQAAAGLDDTVSITKLAWGLEHPRVGRVLTMRAKLWAAKDNDLRAIQECRRAIAAFVGNHGEGHVDTADSRSTLSEMLMNRAEDPNAPNAAAMRREAEEQASKAMKTRERELGTEHPLYADSLADKARIEIFKGKVSSASKLLEKAIAIYRAKFGEDHHHHKVAQHLTLLATITKDDVLREELVSKADEILKAVFEDDWEGARKALRDRLGLEAL